MGRIDGRRQRGVGAAVIRASRHGTWCVVPLLLLVACGPDTIRDAARASGYPAPTKGEPVKDPPALAGDAGPCGERPSSPGVAGAYRPITSSEAPREAISAAEAELPRWLASPGASAACGTLDASEAAAARLGVPYGNASLRASSAIYETVQPLDVWEFPVSVNGPSRCLLTIARQDGAWRAVAIGAASRAAALQRIEETHPALGFTGKALVKVFPSCGEPLELVGVHLSEPQPAFLPVPPWTSEVLGATLPKYAGWTEADPLPVLSWDELVAIVRAQR